MSGGALCARLFAAAELVRQGATFADVGTDHAHLPLFLLESGRISRAYLCDINAGPLASAERNVREAGWLDSVELLLTDGALTLADRGITDYAICGMGGELIADIIDRAPHLCEEGVNLILQPMTRQSELRSYLAARGFCTLREVYVTEGDRHYVCLLASYDGVVRDITPAEAEFGMKNTEIVNKTCRIAYINAKIRALERQLQGRVMGGESADGVRELIEAARALLADE